MSIVVTGGAGFIGSCIVRTLNDTGIEDIVIVDDIASTNKWMNIRNKRYKEYIHKSQFLGKLSSFSDITTIIHLGAQSSTTEKNFDYLWSNNFEYTKILWEYCSERHIRFIYASSAATYGDGSQGFDDQMDIDELLPLNGYGYSKQLFDLWVKRQAKCYPVQYVGLKFFNVYGPNEYFKGDMASMAFHGYHQIKDTGKIRLFKSYNLRYQDGEQLRDFVYVKDVCSVILWFLNNPSVSGLYNVGTGQAKSFRELSESIFKAMNLAMDIEYIDMPEYLKEKYQYYTKAEVIKLRQAGYDKEFFSLEDGVIDYVQSYLNKGCLIY